ncbi:MAG: hypothetical protein QXT19_00910 [Candidatus Woesearchaeota archaeon]
MDKWEIILLGIVSIAALIFMILTGYNSMTGRHVSNYEYFDVGSDVLKMAPRNYPPLPPSLFSKANTTLTPQPPKELLTPQFVEFSVNRIPIPEITHYNYLTLYRNDIHTYSGRAGYYALDPTPYLQAYLCSYAYKIQGAPLACEQVELAYKGGIVSFARGYTPDRYIAARAVGTDFAALYVLASPEYGILAISPIAYLRWGYG